MTIDLSILKKAPEPSKEVILEIAPLAPLSMVSDLPGSYYKALKSPSKKMLCGLFENILEWHIDLADRKEIIKEVKKTKKKPKPEYQVTNGSSFIPLLMDYFEVQLELLPPQLHFDDYWSRAFRRADAIVHPKGTFNISYEIIPLKRELARSEKRQGQVDDKALETFFQERKDEYPLYYSSPTKREYVSMSGNYEIKLLMDVALYYTLQRQLDSTNMSYLGNSEGWVDIKIKEL